MPRGPRVSIVTIFLNGGAFLAEAIESVLAQTFASVEHVLVDDGSTDEATAIAKDYAARHPERIRYVEHPAHANLGMSASRNAGVAASTGELLGFLDVDDVYLPTKIARQVSILDAHPEVGMVYGAHLYWHGWTGHDEDRARDWTWNHFGIPADSVVDPPELVRHYLRDGLTVPFPGCLLVRRSVFERVGGFDPRFRTQYEDQVFFCKVALDSRVFVSSDSLEKYRQHPDSACASTDALGIGLAFRKVFLEWLEMYLLRERVFDAAIWWHLESELSVLREPRLRRIRARLRRSLRAMSRRIPLG